MALQISVAVQNARLDVIESTIGTSPILKIWAGTIRSACATADDATATNVLATLTLPSDWMGAASSNSKAKSGTWQDASADHTGTAAYFRLYDSVGTTCHMQGTVGTSGADMNVDSVSFTAGQSFTVTGFTLADANS